MNDLLTELGQLINKKNLSRGAKKRLRVDLNAISLRLVKFEYETSGIVENTFDVPETFRRMYKHLDTYSKIAKTWSSILFNLAVGNHIIDDLILHYFAKKAGINTNEFYENEQALVDFWKRVLLNKNENQKEITQKISDIFKTIIANGGYLCLSQYKSYMDKMLDLEKEFLFSRAVFTKIIKNLMRSEFINLNVKNYEAKNQYFSAHDVVILKKTK